MSVSTLTLWFVCGLGTAILTAAAPISRGGIVASVLAFAAGAWWAQQPFAPTTALTALSAGGIAIWQVVRSPGRPYAITVAGLLAGVWTAVLETQGLPLLAAIPVAALLPIASIYLRLHRAAFAPPQLAEEALLILAVIGVVGAALPGVAEGWRAAVNLSAQGGQASTAAANALVPMWTLAATSLALLSGGLFSLWSRR